MTGLSMRFETGRTEYDEDNFNPDAWYVVLYDEDETSEHQGDEVVEFAGEGEIVNKFSFLSERNFSNLEKKVICEKVVSLLKAVFGKDFEPKFPHQIQK